VIEVPQSFVVREECEKAAFQNGFRRHLGESQGWAAFASTTARGAIHLAAAGVRGPWFLALDHGGIIAELGLPAAVTPGPGKTRYAFDTLGELYATLNRVYALGVSLPDAPLREFELRVTNLPRTTEAERLVIQRVGQEVFRDALMTYWGGRCAVTGVAEPHLLRASHIKPWARCETDAERLDAYNGLLLAVHLDAAFDVGLISFTDDGDILLADQFGQDDREILRIHAGLKLRHVAAGHRPRLAWHRANLFGSTS